jgi:hypothetical protein
MNKLAKLLSVSTIVAASVIGLSACAVTESVSDTITTQPGNQSAERIDEAKRTVVAQNVTTVATQLEYEYAMSTIYTVPAALPEGVKVITSESGYIISGSTESGETAYRVSGIADVYWFDAPATDISELVAKGVVIPSGITTLP